MPLRLFPGQTQDNPVSLEVYYSVALATLEKSLAGICQLCPNKAEIKKKKSLAEFLTLRIWSNSTNLFLTFGYSVLSALPDHVYSSPLFQCSKESVHLFVSYHTGMNCNTMQYICVYVLQYVHMYKFY